MNVSGASQANAVRIQNANVASKAMARLASGNGDSSPSSVAISSTLSSLISSGESASSNMQDAVSALQTSGGYMGSISGGLSQMKKLAVQAQSGTLSSADLANVQDEFSSLQDSIKSVTSNYNAFGNFNGVELFQGGSENVQTGASQGQATNLENPDLTVQSQASIGTVDTYSYDASNALVGSSHAAATWGSVINSVSGLSATDANAAGVLDKAIAYVASAQSSNAASISDLVSSYGSMATYDANLSAAFSLNSGSDVSSDMIALTKSLVMSQAANAMQTQGGSLTGLAMQWAMKRA